MRGRAFTLVEILIVVVILGILAAIVIPQYAAATDQAAESTTIHDLQKLRRAIEVYKAKEHNSVPSVVAGNGTWDVIVSPDYIKSAPTNAWVGGSNSRIIVIDSSPDTEYQTDYGWIFDDTTGDIWAGGFDGNDKPWPKP